MSVWSLHVLFRIGHAQVRRLQEAAKALASDPTIELWRDRGDSEKDDYGEEQMDRDLLTALLDTLPLYSGYDVLRPGERRAYARKSEIEHAATRLDAIRDRLAVR